MTKLIIKPSTNLIYKSMARKQKWDWLVNNIKKQIKKNWTLFM